MQGFDVEVLPLVCDVSCVCADVRLVCASSSFEALWVCECPALDGELEVCCFFHVLVFLYDAARYEAAVEDIVCVLAD